MSQWIAQLTKNVVILLEVVGICDIRQVWHMTLASQPVVLRIVLDAILMKHLF
jgi:hypothetical protein